MKVFISWSGELGRSLAECLWQWLPQVIQASKPYFSPDDVAKGSRWSEEIGRELDQAQLGILVITRESLDAPWLLFEAGALSKNLGRAKVVPMLFDLEPTDLRGPLVQFQAAKFESSEMKRVLRMLNSQLGDLALPGDVLDASFEIWWPRLKANVEATLRRFSVHVPSLQRSDRELLEEMLELLRTIGRLSVSTREPTAEEQPITDAQRDTTRRLSSAEVMTRLASGGNLIGANLEEISLPGVDLRGANLRGANLARANLVGCNLTNANLLGANLEAAILDECILEGTNLAHANLWCTRMNHVRSLPLAADVTEANFFEVRGLSDQDQEFLSSQNVLAFGDYPSLFAYYHQKSLTAAEMEDLFLWASTPDYLFYTQLWR